MRVVNSPVNMFEFNIQYATGKTSSVSLGVRVPIAGDAMSLVNQVEDYWIAREPLQVMTLPQLQARERNGWILTVGGLAAFLGVIVLFVMLNPPGRGAIAPLSALALTFPGFARALRARMVRFRKFGK